VKKLISGSKKLLNEKLKKLKTTNSTHTKRKNTKDTQKEKDIYHRVIGIIVENMSQQRKTTQTDTGGASGSALSVPQVEPMGVLQDLIDYTQDYGLVIQSLSWGDRSFRLVCKGYMGKITQSFIDKVAEKGWHILAITADPKKPLEVEMFVDITLDYTPQ